MKGIPQSVDLQLRQLVAGWLLGQISTLEDLLLALRNLIQAIEAEIVNQNGKNSVQ